MNFLSVFDQYNSDKSVKGEERSRRLASVSGAREYQVIAGRKVPLWQTLMALSVNKSTLTNFFQYICDNAPKSRELVSHLERKIYLSDRLANGEETLCISSQGSLPVPELFCNHE